MRLPLSSKMTSKTSWYSPVDRIAVQGLDFHVLAVGVLVARLGEFLFLGGEALDDLLGRDALGLDVFERAFLGAHGQSRVRRQQGNTKQQTTRVADFIMSSLSKMLKGSLERDRKRSRAAQS